MIRHVPVEPRDVRRSHPDAVHDANQQPMNEMTTGKLPCSQECIYHKDDQPEERLDVGWNPENRRQPIVKPKSDKPKINFQFMGISSDTLSRLLIVDAQRLLAICFRILLITRSSRL